MTLREELVQVAAVTVAMIEQLDFGVAAIVPNDTDDIIDDIIAERLAQDLKWGPRTQAMTMWMTILMEEVGEAAQEILGKP